jgi:uncharacterized RDD family membrane protein YckC
VRDDAMDKYMLDARPWKRFAAFILDSLLLTYLVIGSFAQWIMAMIPKGTTGDLSAGAVLGLFLMFTFILLYFTLFDYMIGQSLGMMIFGLHTVDDDRKTIPGFWKCTVRNLAVMPFFPIMLLTVIDPLYLAFKGIRLSDMLTGSYVVEMVRYSQG